MNETPKIKAASGNPHQLHGVPIWLRFRYPIVLVSAVLLAVVQPLTQRVATDYVLFELLCSVLILAVMLLVIPRKKVRLFGVPLGLLAILVLWTSHICEDPLSRYLLISAHLLAAAFFGIALYGIVSSILLFRIRRNAGLSAVFGYLLLGIIWMLLYTAVETATPGSFRIPLQDAGELSSVRSVRSMLGYFSFITLATVGYGDVTPVTPLSRTLAWMEAVAGQFYLGVLVAGLVGVKVTQALERVKSGDSGDAVAAERTQSFEDL
jgi:voltage-gated potassium channel